MSIRSCTLLSLRYVLLVKQTNSRVPLSLHYCIFIGMNLQWDSVLRHTGEWYGALYTKVQLMQ